jgi:putative Mn2+ efflux pump MntP
MFQWSALKIVLLSCISSIDNFAVGLSYSLAGRLITLSSNSLMGMANALTTLAAMVMGSAVAKIVDPDLASTLGSSIFILLGCSELFQYSKGKGMDKDKDIATNNGSTVTAKQEVPSVDESVDLTVTAGEASPLLGKSPNPSALSAPPSSLPDVDLVEATPIALGLCMTNVASGVAAGMSGYNPFIFSSLTLVASITLLLLGQKLAIVFQRCLPPDLLQLFSGLLLVAVGISNIPYLNLPSETDL